MKTRRTDNTDNNIKYFLRKIIFLLLAVNIYIIIIILFSSLFGGREITPQARKFDISHIKEIIDILRYFIQPASSVLLYWNNFLIGRITGNRKGVFNSKILFIFMLCCALNTIFFISGGLSGGGMSAIVFYIIYWAASAAFTGFAGYKLVKLIKSGMV